VLPYIAQGYVDDKWPTIESQLLKAGTRLGTLLNQIAEIPDSFSAMVVVGIVSGVIVFLGAIVVCVTVFVKRSRRQRVKLIV